MQRARGGQSSDLLVADMEEMDDIAVPEICSERTKNKEISVRTSYLFFCPEGKIQCTTSPHIVMIYQGRIHTAENRVQKTFPKMVENVIQVKMTKIRVERSIGS